MLAKSSHHDQQPRPLLSGVVAAANRTPQQGLAAVLDSLMAHPNMGPFIGRQLIQFFVTSNPSAAYVGRVARAFRSGIFTDGFGSIGGGAAGDMRAAMAAVLLDEEARDPTLAQAGAYGRLREPVHYVAGALRAADGITDGDGLVADWGWSGQMNQAPFHSPSVFNYYPPDFPLVGSNLVAPQFGIDTVGASLKRINFANALLFWWGPSGSAANPTIPGASGTRVNLARWEALVDSAGSAGLVERLDETAGRRPARAGAAPGDRRGDGRMDARHDLARQAESADDLAARASQDGPLPRLRVAPLPRAALAAGYGAMMNRRDFLRTAVVPLAGGCSLLHAGDADAQAGGLSGAGLPVPFRRQRRDQQHAAGRQRRLRALQRRAPQPRRAADGHRAARCQLRPASRPGAAQADLGRKAGWR